MDQKEHVATLCALGTIGAAVAGLAFATDHLDTHTLRPGKRKWPGASGQTRPLLPLPPPLPRRSISQPTTPILMSEGSIFSSSQGPFKRLSSAPRPLSITKDDALFNEPPSRDSSKSRRSILRPRTAASRSTIDKRGSSTSSSWLKRLSSFSSHSTSPAPSLHFYEHDDAELPAILPERPVTSATSVPNKLVKRSVSQRGLSHDEAHGQIFRRPATSHQRSQTFKEILARPGSGEDDEMVASVPTPLLQPRTATAPSWRPYFETGFPRKRRRSESATDSSQIRIVSLPVGIEPFMLLGSDMEGSSSPAAVYERVTPEWSVLSAPPTTTSRRPRRSLGSLRMSNRRRNFTDPAVQIARAPATGTISPIQAQGHIAPAADSRLTNGHIRPGSSNFASSPPLLQFDRGTSLRLRDSISASDPPTTSSDVDVQVFSDQESIDFKSDTAYDSVATRATNGSSSGMKESKLETIFAARTSDEADAHSDIWQDLAIKSQDVDHEMSDSPFDQNDAEMHGIGIAISHDKQTSSIPSSADPMLATPPRSASLRTEDFSVTPVPMKSSKAHLDSSPPYLPVSKHTRDYDQVGDMLDDMKLDEDEEIDWSADSDSVSQDPYLPQARPLLSSPSGPADQLIARFQEPEVHGGNANGKMQRPSIFDWSDQHVGNGVSRPRTVHGKQANPDRSRSSGRKGPPQLHFRSQSVPVNRDTSQEDLPTISKYKTWRLGAKPVSEEWSDDFEFDDVEEEPAEITVINEESNFRDSVRSVRIPQAIIDRQPSVHLQFGQVQEFMALVEELKRLRSNGATLQILNGSAKHLWEDAESIINLATINDEEDAPLASSPVSSDPFAELAPISNTVVANGVTASRGRRPTTSGRRSVSAVTTPPVHGRARGESLAHARHFLQVMHQNRGTDSSPREIEIHQQKKLPFDTQDLKDLVVRSGVITRALKEEVRRAEGVSISPCKTPQSKRDDKRDDPFSESFWRPDPRETSPSPSFGTKPGLPKSRSAHSYLESAASRQDLGPFSSPLSLAAAV